MSLSEAAQVAARVPAPWTRESMRQAASEIRRVVILKTLWYPEVLEPLEHSARAYLEGLGVSAKAVETRIVPGSFELPLAALQACRPAHGERVADFVVALGCVVKGSTPHFDFVSSAAVDGLMRVTLDTQVPVGLGVLTVESLTQALERKEKGLEAAQAAFFMYLASLPSPGSK